MNEQGSISPLGVQHTINSFKKAPARDGSVFFLSKAYGLRSKDFGMEGMKSI